MCEPVKAQYATASIITVTMMRKMQPVIFLIKSIPITKTASNPTKYCKFSIGIP